MLKRFEIIQNEDMTVKLHCVEKFDVVVTGDLEVKDILAMLRECFSLDALDNEHVYIVSMNYCGEVIGVLLVSIGDYKGCNIYNRSIGIFLLLSGAKKFLMIHNHPDGQIYASTDDIVNAIAIENLGNFLGLNFLGSYIIGRDGWCKVADGNEDYNKWEDYI